MTTSQMPFEPGAFTTPVVDYEPPPIGVAYPPCPSSPFPSGGWAPSLRGEYPQSPAALHRPARRLLRAVDRVEAAPPREAAAFADAVLRRVLEVIDRRRPIAQLRTMLTPPLLDTVFALTQGAASDKTAVLRRVRLRATAAEPAAAEVFATYTRGQRVRAIAGRVEIKEGRWRLVALQVG